MSRYMDNSIGGLPGARFSGNVGLGAGDINCPAGSLTNLYSWAGDDTYPGDSTIKDGGNFVMIALGAIPILCGAAAPTAIEVDSSFADAQTGGATFLNSFVHYPGSMFANNQALLVPFTILSPCSFPRNFTFSTGFSHGPTIGIRPTGNAVTAKADANGAQCVFCFIRVEDR
jgi:hypothetical protein